MDRVVAVTFTEKAAGEMKLRLRTEIERARQDCAPEQRALLEQALRELELAKINTIHSFCGDLLRERPVGAGVDPLFEIVAEDEDRDIADRAFESWFQAALANPPAVLFQYAQERRALYLYTYDTVGPPTRAGPRPRRGPALRSPKPGKLHI